MAPLSRIGIRCLSKGRRQSMMSKSLIRDVEQFLYQEARLLDNRQFHRWLELFTDDARYWMPMRSNRYPISSKAITILDGSRYEEGELFKEGDLAIFDESKDSLRRRIERLDTGMAWAEDPPSRTRHFISNIEVHPGDMESELKVYSNFIMYRTRGETEQDFYVGSREDTLRKVGGAWRIAHRRIILDQNVLLAKNVSNFF
jgi:biphenyl 2,3-dioxygenase beta subunit